MRKYLGIPSMIGRKKKSIFNYLRDKIWKQIQHQSGKHLSKVGRVVLVKSIAQEIPSYCMGTFRIPPTLQEEIQRMMNYFLWGSNINNNKMINWLLWEHLSIRKKHRGMSFRYLLAFNLAILGKQGWKLISNPDVLLHESLKLNIFQRGIFQVQMQGTNQVFHGEHPQFMAISQIRHQMEIG